MNAHLANLPPLPSLLSPTTPTKPYNTRHRQADPNAPTPRTSPVPRPSVRVGFIPGGSTDSVAMCLHGTADPTTAALHILLGDYMQVRDTEGGERRTYCEIQLAKHIFCTTVLYL